MHKVIIVPPASYPSDAKTKFIPHTIYQVLSEELDKTDAEIYLMSMRERFDAYCNWEGLIHWGDKLFDLARAEDTVRD